MYKKMLGRPLFWLPWLWPHRTTMPPSTGHEWSLNGLMNMKNPIPWLCQSPDRNAIEILEWCLRQHFPPPSTKRQRMVDVWSRIPPIEFQTLVESMQGCFEAVRACGGPNPDLRHCWYFLIYIPYILSIGEK